MKKIWLVRLKLTAENEKARVEHEKKKMCGLKRPLRNWSSRVKNGVVFPSRQVKWLSLNNDKCRFIPNPFFQNRGISMVNL